MMSIGEIGQLTGIGETEQIGDLVKAILRKLGE